MAITSKGFTGSVDQVEWAKMMTAASGSGLTTTYGGTGFSATISGSLRTFTIQPGTLWASGVRVDMDLAATTTASSANVSGLPRIDLVVMRVNWSTMASALTVIEGTPAGSPQPPTFNKNPGVVVDIPLVEARLNSGGAAYVSGSAVSRRYWVQDGLTVVPAGVRLPDMVPGRVVVQPDSRVLVGGSSVDMEFRPWDETNWGPIPLSAPGGFSGSVYGSKLNGVTELEFAWTKTGGGTGAGIEFGVTLPSGWRPKGPGSGINRVIWGGGDPLRVYILPTGGVNLGPMTLNAGEMIRGGFQFISQ